MLPKIILHNAVSLDGKVEGFMPDIELFYQLAGTFDFDVHLVGSTTILKQEDELPEDDEDAFKQPEKKEDDTRPLLVVPDSKGRIKRWQGLRKAGFWRDVLALCSEFTTGSYRDFLKERHVDHIVTGEEKVDMKEALKELASKYGVKTVLLDSGGTLNGVLLREGLVSELSLLVHPCVVGKGTSLRSFFRDPTPDAETEPLQLDLIDMERLKDDFIWLRYLIKTKAK